MTLGTIIQGNFKPAWWLPDSHSQTLWPYLFRSSQKLKVKPQRIELPDGDFIDICWNNIDTGPIVVIFHGLEGSIDSPYASRLMSALEQTKWRSVFMHFRGCSGVPNRLDKSYHSGDTSDIRYFIQHLSQNFPDTPIVAIGYSLGGNALLKYLGESGKNTPVIAAIAISVPYLLSDCSLKLSTGFSKIYQWWLVRSLIKKVKYKFSHKVPPINLSNIDKLNTFYKFDDKITSQLNGFESADDYYSRSSCKQYLRNICVPTLLIHAKNDPFMTPEVIPKMNELSSYIELELTDKGGHVGFIGGKVPWKPVYWLEKRIIKFIQSQLT